MKRIRLNMWQRLGIVASVIWIIFAGVKRRTHIADTALVVARMDRDDCQRAGQPDCEAVFHRSYQEIVSGGWDWVAADAIIPVALTWVGAYVVLAIARWVLAGRAT